MIVKTERRIVSRVLTEKSQNSFRWFCFAVPDLWLHWKVPFRNSPLINDFHLCWISLIWEKKSNQDIRGDKSSGRKIMSVLFDLKEALKMISFNCDLIIFLKFYFERIYNDNQKIIFYVSLLLYYILLSGWVAEEKCFTTFQWGKLYFLYIFAFILKGPTSSCLLFVKN